MRLRAAFVALAVIAAVAAGIPHASAQTRGPVIGVRAGVGIVDATWHVGASAGQYASGRYGIDDCVDFNFVETCRPRVDELATADFDPELQQTKRVPSYGVQSRLSARAIVVEGRDGTRVALVKIDNYLAQDVLARRVGQLLDEGDSGVRYDHILMHATHNHSSPYYTTPAVGPWVFQDVMDLRMLEYQARAIATAIEEAAGRLVPVRMGATTVPLTGVFRNAPGPTVANDGSPTGYPDDEDDTGLVVMRFDDISDPRHPRPLATWMNYGVHPESLDGYNLISADYLGPLERMVGRATGAPLVFSQGDVGSAETADFLDQRLPNGTVRAFAHRGYAQNERMARVMADAVIAGWNDVGAGRGAVPYATDFPVRMISRWTPGPVSHPYPSVSNCRTEPNFSGQMGLPVLGLPDCERVDTVPAGAEPLFSTLKMLGAPVPENYDAPSFMAVEENLRIHLQTVRLGEVLLASCSCEPQVDLVKNLESRTDNVAGNIYDGYAWEQHCARAGADWRCADPRKHNLADRSLVVSDAAYRKMVAEVHNDAAGWDSVANAATADAEPADPSQIKGNFTKEELPASRGYKLAVGIGHAGDYNGYTVSYRMYMSYDHYRKALTSYGPHTADYMVTRLVRMAGQMKGGPAPAAEPLDAVAQADEVRQELTARGLGAAAAAAYAAWPHTLPDDPTTARVVAQPRDITRFAAAEFSWVGGNNYVDNPAVRVERFVDGEWRRYADQTGEVQVRVDFPKGVTSAVTAHTQPMPYRWTANFEAADFFPREIDPRGPNIPDGRYRFVADGLQQRGGKPAGYRLVSKAFEVRPWTGIRVDAIAVMADGRVAARIAPITYPRTYRSSFRVIGDDRGHPVCETCSFRPWAESAAVKTVAVHIRRANGKVETAAATAGSDGIWRTTTRLRKGDRAVIEAGGVVDNYGERNGQPSAVVGPK